MRKAVATFAIASLSLASCTAITQDLHHTGGYPGYLLDRHSFNASGSKELLLLRATIVFAMAARMGQATLRGEDADSFALNLAAAAREINYAAADLYPADKTMPCSISTPSAGEAVPDIDAQRSCAGYRVNFESEVPLIEARLIKLVVAALPTDKARQFLSAVTKGDVLGAAIKGLGTFRSLAAGLHYANGSYRSGLEIVATQECEGSFDQVEHTVAKAVECLNVPDDILATTEKTKTNLIHVSPTAFAALMAIGNNACSALPFLKPVGAAAGASGSTTINTDDRDKACKTVWFQPTARPVTPRISAPASSSSPPPSSSLTLR